MCVPAWLTNVKLQKWNVAAHSTLLHVILVSHPSEQSYVHTTLEMHCIELHMLRLFNKWQMHTRTTSFDMHFINTCPSLLLIAATVTVA